jgi:hypothetical protein
MWPSTGPVRFQFVRVTEKPMFLGSRLAGAAVIVTSLRLSG